jgi:hypothetical protein
VEITDRTIHQKVIKIGGMSGNSGNSDNKRPRVEDSWALVLEQFTKLEVKALAGEATQRRAKPAQSLGLQPSRMH